MMLLTSRSYKFNQLIRINKNLKIVQLHLSMEKDTEIERIVRIINDHPFPDKPLSPILHSRIPQAALSTPFVEKVLGKLFAAHSNGLKAYEFFKYCLHNQQYNPSSDAFEKTLHILTRMRYFDKAWELMERIKQAHPSLLTLKSMSIMLSRIAKFQSYEETLAAFEKMQMDIFSGNKFWTNEFNVLLRAFCTQRQMKEARAVFNKMHSQFPPNTKTMNILLLGFKESGDVTAVELFYHEMIRRGFKPNSVTYSIRIDAYCKKGHFGDALRLFEAMESANCAPSLETITTLIHGAGVARNITKAKQLFEDIPKRSLQPDTAAYNALLSSLIRSKDVISATALMDEMEKRNIEHDNVTYHTMFLGLMRSEGIGGVSTLYVKMVEKKFVPKTRTIVMLIKFFCENCRVDLGLDLWNYLMKKGHCPHSHALDLLVTGLCARGRVEEAFVCCKQMLERGRTVSLIVFKMLERVLVQMGEVDKLEELRCMIKKLKLLLPPPKQDTINLSFTL
ncbi:pentatricopeptide repeat-containing protein At3g61360 [Sesamum indicum]|uniref:Pentatricopeptide repeat-containing protein At3g61360 n=1 Tax=Sesamum indicum TaxID=4182 RepID=A0A6I9UPN2_SESIN|nr:pentatricopeptide repeat-containing protein At3g61360 [Sesamum indicum]XP_011101513.1 pentatricopeptide repeat-containing protein At3g61360 [Sesamum indicum]